MRIACAARLARPAASGPGMPRAVGAGVVSPPPALCFLPAAVARPAASGPEDAAGGRCGGGVAVAGAFQLAGGGGPPRGIGARGCRGRSVRGWCRRRRPFASCQGRRLMTRHRCRQMPCGAGSRRGVAAGPLRLAGGGVGAAASVSSGRAGPVRVAGLAPASASRAAASVSPVRAAPVRAAGWSPPAPSCPPAPSRPPPPASPPARRRVRSLAAGLLWAALALPLGAFLCSVAQAADALL